MKRIVVDVYENKILIQIFAYIDYHIDIYFIIFYLDIYMDIYTYISTSRQTRDLYCTLQITMIFIGIYQGVQFPQA